MSDNNFNIPVSSLLQQFSKGVTRPNNDPVEKAQTDSLMKNEPNLLSVKNLRLKVGMSQQKFADHFGIPIGTIKAWEQCRRNPPSYIVDMMEKILRYQKKLR